jgi:integrase
VLFGCNAKLRCFGIALRRGRLRDCWTPIRSAAKLPEDFKFHGLRHQCATELLRLGVPAKQVQERLGHFSVAFTLDTYAAFVPSMQAAATAAMGGFLGRLVKRGLRSA